MTIYDTLMATVGRTPLVRIGGAPDLRAEVVAKLERFNPTGSVKDRAAFAMLQGAENRGLLRQGMVVVEATSGNTGIALASLARAKGYGAILVMPDTISRQKVRVMAAFGARIVFTPGVFGMKRAFSEARRIADSMPNAFVPDQARNPANPEFHRSTTGPEIWADTEGAVDVCVMGVGTGGTLTGVGEFLKSKKPAVEIVAVEPKGSPVLSGGQRGPHRIEGIGVGFVPEVLNTQIIDRIETVSDEEALETVDALAQKTGIFAGVSSGAAAHAALRLAREVRYDGKLIVTLFPDSGERYPELGSAHDLRVSSAAKVELVRASRQSNADDGAGSC